MRIPIRQLARPAILSDPHRENDDSVYELHFFEYKLNDNNIKITIFRLGFTWALVAQVYLTSLILLMIIMYATKSNLEYLLLYLLWPLWLRKTNESNVSDVVNNVSGWVHIHAYFLTALYTMSTMPIDVIGVYSIHL